mgnify:CR=1 FL=1
MALTCQLYLRKIIKSVVPHVCCTQRIILKWRGLCGPRMSLSLISSFYLFSLLHPYSLLPFPLSLSPSSRAADGAGGWRRREWSMATQRPLPATSSATGSSTPIGGCGWHSARLRSGVRRRFSPAGRRAQLPPAGPRAPPLLPLPPPSPRPPLTAAPLPPSRRPAHAAAPLPSAGPTSSPPPSRCSRRPPSPPARRLRRSPSPPHARRMQYKQTKKRNAKEKKSIDRGEGVQHVDRHQGAQARARSRQRQGRHVIAGGGAHAVVLLRS